VTDVDTTPSTITFDDFMKVDVRVGEITSATKVPKSEKLLMLTVDLGELGTRTIMAGIAKSYEPEHVVGTCCLVVVNLAPRKMMGVESHGMLLAGESDGCVRLAFCNAAPGTRIG